MRLVLADDSVLLREGLASILTARGYDVVAQAGDGPELLRKVAGHRPDLAVVDIRMPPTGTDEGLQAARTIGESHPDVGVLLLSEYLDAEYALRLLDSGAPGRGYLLKHTVTRVDLLVDAVERVGAGGSVVDPAIARRLVERRRIGDPLGELTDREREILALMAEGRSNQAIARCVVVTDRTVEAHVRSIFRKLDLEPADDDNRRVRAVLRYLEAE